MKRRIIEIDENKCNGCGACAEACHEGAIAMVDGKAKLMRDDYCDGLGDCLPACPTGAITFVERQAARELVKAYIHGVESAALDDVFELLAWNQGIGFFSSEIGPSALFQAYKLIKNGEKQGKSREDICSALREKFGEKNPEMQVLNR